MSRRDEFNVWRGNPLTQFEWAERRTIGCYECGRSVFDKVKRRYKCLAGIQGHPYMVAGNGPGECPDWKEKPRMKTREDAEKLFK